MLGILLQLSWPCNVAEGQKRWSEHIRVESAPKRAKKRSSAPAPQRGRRRFPYFFSLMRRTKRNKRRWLRSRRSRPQSRIRERRALGAPRDLVRRHPETSRSAPPKRNVRVWRYAYRQNRMRSYRSPCRAPPLKRPRLVTVYSGPRPTVRRVTDEMFIVAPKTLSRSGDRGQSRHRRHDRRELRHYGS
jgi:hypothetical protein